MRYHEKLYYKNHFQNQKASTENRSSLIEFIFTLHFSFSIKALPGITIREMDGA